MSKTLTKKLISTFVMLIMVLSAFVVISSNVSAQTSASPAQVGTFTLNPATGAFPGQLVTYTWTGVPSTLTAPVYVTVYLNDTPYSTSEAAYSGTVLTGTFTMPNDNVGTVFTVSLSYKDSSQNYGVSSSSISSKVNVYGAPITEFSPINSASFGVPYKVTANVNYSANKTVTSLFNGGSGYISGYTNSTFNTSTLNTKKIPSNNTADLKLSGYTNYTSQAFTNESAQKLTINATALNNGPASLSLAANAIFTSTFTMTATSITGISLLAYINQTVNNQPVNFTISGKYTFAITKTGTDTMLGTIKATGESPPQLKENFSGNIAASYAINAFGLSSGKYYVNYTLSVTISGSTPNNVVTLNARYLNNQYLNSTSATTPFSSANKLAVQSGYAFDSSYIGLENPGIAGTFIQNFWTGSPKIWTGNLTFSFKNYTKGSLALFTLWYDNQSVKMSLANQTLSGYMNITVSIGFYSAGVEYISPAVWNVTLLVSFNLANKYGVMLYNTTHYYVQRQISPTVTALLSSGQTLPVNGIVTIAPPSTFVDMVGYLNLKSVKIPYTAYTLVYGKETATVMQNATWTGNVNLTAGTDIKGEAVNSTVSGFNVTLSSITGIKLWITVSKVNPVIYAIQGNGNVTITKVNVTGAPTWKSPNSYISEVYTANFTTKLVMPINNAWKATSTGTNTNLTFANFTLREIYGAIHYAEVTQGMVSFESSYFSGAITMTGLSNSNITSALVLAKGSKETSLGNITTITGFKNTSILGWYNTTFTVHSVMPALYGGILNGTAVIWANVTIQNASHPLSIDPQFRGQQNVSLIVSIISNVKAGYYNNVTFSKLPDASQNLTLTGTGKSGYLNDLVLSSTFSVTNTLYNITDTFAYQAMFNHIPFYGYTHSYAMNDINLSFVSGDVPIAVNNSSIKLAVDIGSPILNLTLSPLANISFTIEFNANNTTLDYYIMNGNITNTYYSTTFTSLNNTVFSISPALAATGNATIKTTVEESQIVLQALVNNVTITTNPFYVADFGQIPVSGLASSEYGSGAASGTLTVSKIYPATLDEIQLSGVLNAQLFNANGTQYSISVSFLNTPIMLNTEGTVLVPVTVNAVFNQISEMSNTGTSTAVSYSLLQGNGALLTGISSSQIATIEAAVNNTVSTSMQVPLSELSANITKLNGDIVTIETAFGTMTSTLQAINASVVSVAAGVAVLSTDIGFVQTSLNTLSPIIMSISNTTAHIETMAGNITLSLNALNAKITAVNGTVATLNTTMGTVTTSLSSIGATVTSISGNVATISTSLGTLSGTVTSISNGVATIQTNLGTLTASVNSIKSTTSSTSSSVGNTMIFEIVVLVLILVTLALVAYTIGQVRKQGPKKPEEIKAPEEEKKE